jgi:hypothetical protein
MGKSFKKNPVSRVKGPLKDTYWKSIRRSIKNVMSSVGLEELEEKLPDPKTIVNDYDYIDYAGRDETNKKMYRK